MNKKRVEKSTSPHSVAAIAALMVLVAGIGVGAYFVEFRGVGYRTLMAGAQAQEILMLFGGLAVCTLMTQLMVARKARPRASQDSRDMVRAVLDLDPSDPNAMRKLGSFPELRELAMMIAAEKSAKVEALQQLQTQRREVSGLLKGMERSAESGDPIREEQNSEICSEIARVWNAMQAKRSAAAKSAAPDLSMGGPGSPEPGMVTLGAVEPAQAPGIDAAVSDDMRRRVAQVEDSLQALQRQLDELASAPAPVQPEPASAPALFADEPEGFEPETLEPEALQRFEPGPGVEAPVVDLGAAADTEQDEVTPTPSAYHEWNAGATSDAPSPPQPTADEPLPGLERTGFAPPIDLAGTSDEAPVADPATETPAAPRPSGSFEADKEFSQHFPHFVGQPVGPGAEQVGVTFGKERAPGQPTPPQAGLPPLDEDAQAVVQTAANPRQFPESEIIDLRSLGAVEFED